MFRWFRKLFRQKNPVHEFRQRQRGGSSALSREPIKLQPRRISRPKEPTRTAHPEIYYDMRSQALHGSRTAFGLTATSKPTEPWGILMEIGLAQGSATIVALSDGSASIYLSSGGGSTGGIGHETIRKAAQAMVALAGKFQSQMSATANFPIPMSGQTIFYLLTDAGVFTASAAEADLGEQRHLLSPLFYAGQEVITQYRLVEERK
jgi:hypothetical protein